MTDWNKHFGEVYSGEFSVLLVLLVCIHSGSGFVVDRIYPFENHAVQGLSFFFGLNTGQYFS